MIRIEEELERRERLEEDNLLAAYRRLFATADGRLVLDDLLYKCGLYRRSFTGNAETYFREGQRDIGLYLLDRLDRAELADLEEMRTRSRARLEEAHARGLAELAREVEAQLAARSEESTDNPNQGEMA